jgi:hypothetical protein
MSLKNALLKVWHAFALALQVPPAINSTFELQAEVSAANTVAASAAAANASDAADLQVSMKCIILGLVF